MLLPSVPRWALFSLAICAATSSCNGQEREFSSLLPDSTVAYVELAPAEKLLGHPMREKLQRSEAFLKLWRSPEVLKMRGGMTVAELALGDSLENVASKLTDGGMAIGVDRKHNGAVLLARSTDREWLESYLERIVKLAQDDAKAKGNENTFKETDYRGLTVYKIGEAIFTSLDEILLVTNQQELGKAIVDGYLAGGEVGQSQSLSASTQFQLAAESRQRARDNQSAGGELAASQEIGWGFIDIAALRDAGLAQDLLGGQAKDFAAELILGGLLANLHHTPVVTASLKLEEQSIALELSSPHDSSWGGEERDFFFGTNGRGQTLPTLNSEETVASLSAYRDLSQMWLRAGDLFNEQVNDQLAQADSTLTTLFSGRDFGEEILGALHPELRLVVARQVFDGDQPTPAIRLPSFALVGQLREPTLMRSELKRIFQSLIGFLNIVGAMEGQPQLDQNMETDGDQQLLTATYVREIDRQSDANAPIQFNFSPSVAFVGDSVIISSTIPLAKQLAKQLQLPADSAATNSKPSTKITNTILQVSGTALLQTLTDNLDQLIAQNMLEEGHSKDEAEAEIGMLLSIITLFKDASLQLEFDTQARLSAQLNFADQ